MNWEIRSDHVAGDFGFDPLGLKPTDPAELIEMQPGQLIGGALTETPSRKMQFNGGEDLALKSLNVAIAAPRRWKKDSRSRHLDSTALLSKLMQVH